MSAQSINKGFEKFNLELQLWRGDKPASSATVSELRDIFGVFDQSHAILSLLYHRTDPRLEDISSLVDREGIIKPEMLSYVSLLYPLDFVSLKAESPLTLSLQVIKELAGSMWILFLALSPVLLKQLFDMLREIRQRGKNREKLPTSLDPEKRLLKLLEVPYPNHPNDISSPDPIKEYMKATGIPDRNTAMDEMERLIRLWREYNRGKREVVKLETEVHERDVAAALSMHLLRELEDVRDIGFPDRTDAYHEGISKIIKSMPGRSTSGLHARSSITSIPTAFETEEEDNGRNRKRIPENL